MYVKMIGAPSISIHFFQDDFRSLLPTFELLNGIGDRQTILVLLHGGRSISDFLSVFFSGNTYKRFHVVEVFAFCLKPSRVPVKTSGGPTVCFVAEYNFCILLNIFSSGNYVVRLCAV